MSDAAFQRWIRLVELADGRIPPRQRTVYERACDQALDAALSEAEALDPRKRTSRFYDIYARTLQTSCSENPRRPVGECSDDEAAALFIESLGAKDKPMANAVRRSAGMPAALAKRLRALAEEGRL